MTMTHGKWNMLHDRKTVHTKVQISFQHYFQCVFTVNIFFDLYNPCVRRISDIPYKFHHNSSYVHTKNIQNLSRRIGEYPKFHCAPCACTVNKGRFMLFSTLAHSEYNFPILNTMILLTLEIFSL